PGNPSNTTGCSDFGDLANTFIFLSSIIFINLFYVSRYKIRITSYESRLICHDTFKPLNF
ncbi:MAG: hypothetical protein ACE5J3_14100, partial [Methanosarcinales archaeon]